jgi:hypothetical protein
VELELISRTCSASSRNDTSRKLQACNNGGRFASRTQNCDAAKRLCADEYDLTRASDPFEEADVFSSCWTAARAYMLQRNNVRCVE